jgi:hypothetical protein
MIRRFNFSLVLGLVCSTSCTWTIAAPVTVHFAAVLDTPRQGVSEAVPPNWGFSLQQGDAVTGSFTVESLDAEANAFETYVVEPSNFMLQIKSKTLNTSRFFIRSRNDVWGDDIDLPYDSLEIGCGFDGETACNPSAVPQLSSLKWAFGLYAYGNVTILEGPDIPVHQSVWQKFDFNQLLVSFSDRQSEFYGFLANVQFFTVPEPSVIRMMFLCLSLIAIVRRRSDP